MSCAKSQSASVIRFEEALERLKNTNDNLRISEQRARQIHNASRLRVFDSYASGELALILHVQPALKEDAIRGPLEITNTAPWPEFTSFILYINSLNMRLTEDGNHQPMFVSVVEIVNGPNGNIPSLVRLYCVQQKPVKPIAYDVYFSLRKVSFQFLGGLPHRKLSPIIDERGGDLFNHFQPNVVESAFQIVDSISDAQRDIVEAIGFTEGIGNKLAASLRINLNNSGVCCIQNVNSAFDVRDVVIGPLYL